LQERRDAWRISRTSINYYSQSMQLPEIKVIRPELGLVYAQVLQETLKRLEKAFDAFFRRVAENKKLPKEKRQPVGYPRFRSRSRYDSFTFPQVRAGFGIQFNKLRLPKIGKVKIKLHRPIEGKIKAITITRSSTGKWFACFSVGCEPESLPKSTDASGIDMGLKEFAVLSNGEAIANPKFFRVEEKQLAKANRKLSAAMKGTPERRKRRKVEARVHERIANRRFNFAHQESRKLVNRFALIVFERLNIDGMLKNHHLAKSIADVAWGQLVQLTTYKAECAGRRVVQVNSYNTSQTCSGCGEIVKKDLSVRIHACSGCGLTLDRDHNAAINILALGLQSIGQSTIEAALFRARSSHYALKPFKEKFHPILAAIEEIEGQTVEPDVPPAATGESVKRRATREHKRPNRPIAPAETT